MNDKDKTKEQLIEELATLRQRLNNLELADQQQFHEHTQDQSEHKQVETLHENKLFVQQILETTPDIIYIYDLVEQRNIYLNKQIVEILGYSSQQIQAMKEAVLPNLIHPDDMARVTEHLKRFDIFKAGEVLEIEYRMREASGEWRWLRSRETVFSKNTDGFPVQILGIARDITAHKNSIATLQESEERFRTMADTAPVMIWMADTEMLCTYVNKSWLEFTGRRLEQELGQGWTELVHPNDLQVCLETYTAVFNDQRSLSVEYRLKRFDGEYRWLLNTGTPRFHNDGSFAGYIGSSIDITEQKQTLEALQDNEARLRLALEAARMAHWDWNITTNNVIHHSQLKPLSGLPLDSHDHTFEDFLDGVYSEDRDRVAAAVWDAIENKTNYEVEFRLVSPDNVLRWIENKGQVYYDQTGQAVRMVGVAIDITERKRAEYKIHEQAAWLDVATDAIVVEDLQHHIIFWNKSAERLYGWKAKDALGKNAHQLLFKKTSSQWQEALSQVNQAGEWYGELSQIRKDGKQVIVETRWTLVRDEQGNPKSILTVNTDITAKKQIQAQFLRAQRLESLGTLASGIAHDLNNILAPILMSAQLLGMELSHEQNQQLVEVLETSAQRGAALVKQVLSFARGVEGQRTILQLRHLLLEIEQFAKQTFPKSIEFCTEIAPNLWTVYGDVTQLHQVLMNLMINARDAMPKGGVLSIHAENFLIDENYARMNLDATIGPHVVITIKDTGVGMPPEIVDRIFEPFFTTKEVGKGSGLGLSTVLGILKSHKGFISVSSNVGQGTQFQVFLKAVLENEPQPTESWELPTGNGELILVVDDEAEIREITKITLESYNYKVLTAGDGIEAIASYAQNRAEIRVVFMDMMMPVMDGLTTIRTLLKMNPFIKILAASGLSDSKQLIQAYGVDTFLPKPYTVKQLLQALHKILN